MNVDEFVLTLPKSTTQTISQFRRIILESDKEVKEVLGSIMSIVNTLNYEQEGVFKYGLAVTKNHISFHSMVMYANPLLMDHLKGQLVDVRFQKGCINFSGLEDFPSTVFEEHLRLSASVDFSSAINRYRIKK